MIITLIASMSENRVIGRDGIIPWDIPIDRHRFWEITMGNPLIMGRRTFESIGRPLPGRTNIVLSRRPDYWPSGCIVATGLANALALCDGADEVFVCGGGDVYREALPLAHRLYLTIVIGDWQGDVFFPEIGQEFKEVSCENIEYPVPFKFLVMERRGFR